MIDILYFDEPINDSPFTARAWDPAGVVVSNITPGIIGVESAFNSTLVILVMFGNWSLVWEFVDVICTFFIIFCFCYQVKEFCFNSHYSKAQYFNVFILTLTYA